MNTHADLIDALGGGTKVASAVSAAASQVIDREAVYKWRVNGVPWRWRPIVADLAAEQGIELPPNFFEHSTNGGPGLAGQGREGEAA